MFVEWPFYPVRNSPVESRLTRVVTDDHQPPRPYTLDAVCEIFHDLNRFGWQVSTAGMVAAPLADWYGHSCT